MTQIKGINPNISFLGLKSKNNTSTIHPKTPAFQGTSKVLDLYSSGNTKFVQALKPVSTNISFGAKKIDGVMYSNAAMALGDAMLKPEEAKAMVKANNDKIEQTKNRKEAGNYNNARAGVVQAATAMGDSGKTYTTCNVDFFSSRWGLSAGQIASCMAIGDLNQKVKALAVTDLNHDRKSIQWLANTNDSIRKSRGGRELQIVSVKKTPSGKDQIWVKTLTDTKGFVPKDLPVNHPGEAPVMVEGPEYKPIKIEVNNINYSADAQKVAKNLEAKGINVDEMVKKLAFASQKEADKIDKAVCETAGTYETAPVSHYHFHTSLLADNGKIYSGSNVEFYDSGFMADVMCSERIAMSKGVNDGASESLMLFLNNNQNHEDLLCAECLGWFSGGRGGGDMLILTFDRDDKGNKTDTVKVCTLEEKLPGAYKPSAKVEVK